MAVVVAAAFCCAAWTTFGAPPLRVVRDGRTGFVGRDGQLLAEPAFAVLGDWREDRLWVQTSDGDGDALGGFIDATAQPLAKALYRNLSEARPELPLPFFERGIAVVGLVDGGCGYLDLRGRLVGRAAPAAAFLRQEEELLLGEESGRFGYLDRTGDWRIPARFVEATPFRGNRAAAREDGGWRLLGPDGMWVGNESFDALRWFATNPRVWAYRREERWGLVDRDGRVLCPPLYDELAEGHGDAVMVRVDRLWGLLRETGEVLVAPRYRLVAPFGDDPFAWQVQDDQGRWHVVDAAGSEVGSAGHEALEAHPRGVWLASNGGAWGTLARDGAWVIPQVFQRILPLQTPLDNIALCERENRWGAVRLADGSSLLPGRFSRIREWHGLLAAEDEQTARLFNAQGKELLSWVGGVDGLPAAESVVEGAGILRMQDGTTLISPQGERLWSRPFADAGEWSGDLVPVRIGDRWGFAGRDGSLVVEARFEAAKGFRDGVAPVREQGLWGLIGRDGAYRVKPGFAELGRAWSGLVPASRDGRRWGLIDRDGRDVLPLVYDGIEWGVASRGSAAFHGHQDPPTDILGGSGGSPQVRPPPWVDPSTGKFSQLEGEAVPSRWREATIGKATGDRKP